MNGPYEKNVNFRCVGCGKCCNGPPQLSIREVYTLLDDFPLEVSVLTKPLRMPLSMRAQLDKFHAQASQMGVDRAIELGGVRTVAHCGPLAGAEVVITLSAIVRGYPHKARCPALQADNSCGVYPRRPSTCRYIPAQHLFHADRQDMALGIFKELHGEDCDWSVSSPVVLRNGGLVDREMVDAFAQAEEDERADGDLLRLLLDREGFLDDDEAGIADLIEQSMDDGEATVPVALFTVILAALKEDGDLPPRYALPSVKEVAERQRVVCQRMIEANIRERDRAARPHTEILRAHLAVNDGIMRAL